MEVGLPVKSIKSPMDIKAWESSPAYGYVTGFLESVNKAAMGKSQKVECKFSQTLSKLISVLEELEKTVSRFPPEQQPQRFGNKAFRSWHSHLTQEATEMMKRVLPEEKESYAAHLAEYFKESFGNATRIDFGTGHEVMFLMFITCLSRLDLIGPDDLLPVLTKVFTKYLSLVHLLVGTYVMEPAGSHGSWSLDDYHFLPFLWGSSQLLRHPTLEPSHFPDPEIAEQNKDEFLFMAAIHHINQVRDVGPGLMRS